jgi:hypothetical protein
VAKAGAILLFCFAVTQSVVATEQILKPEANQRLSETIGQQARDVAWLDDETLLVASERNVSRYTLKTGVVSEVLSGSPVPEGLSSPMSIATDGATLIAVSPFSSGSFSLRLSDHKRLIAQQSHKMLASDAGVRGDRACYLAFGPSAPTAAVSCGGVDASWDELKPLHSIRSGEAAAAIYRFSVPPYAGALVMESNGTTDVITSAEPGVFRYSASGVFLGVLGGDLRELVLDDALDIMKLYAVDVDKRYRLLLNRHQTIDGLVSTPNGVAIVVRLAEKDLIHWELWYPDASGGATRRLRLGIERRGPFGHLRCDVRADRMVCVGSAPAAAEAVDPRKSELVPTLWRFHLPKLTR